MSKVINRRRRLLKQAQETERTKGFPFPIPLGSSWYAMDNKLFKFIHYFWCRIFPCPYRHTQCKEVDKWKRRGAIIYRDDTQ